MDKILAGLQVKTKSSFRKENIMLVGIANFPNQSYGLPVLPVAQDVTVRIVDSQRVQVGNIPAQSVNVKSKPNG
jgi:hypothetical protein